MNRVFKFLADKKYYLIAIFAVLIILVTLKTQAVVVTYGEKYSMRLEYTLFGSCIRASAALKETEPAVYNAVYIGGSIDGSVLKAVEQMEKLTDEKCEVGIFASGYPRSNDKLENHLKEIIEQSGRKAKILITELKGKK